MKLPNKLNQRGFAHLAVLVVIVVVLAAVGTYVVVKGHAQNVVPPSGGSTYNYGTSMGSHDGVTTYICRANSTIYAKYSVSAIKKPYLSISYQPSGGSLAIGSYKDNKSTGTVYGSAPFYSTSYYVHAGPSSTAITDASNPSKLISNVNKCY